MIARGYHRGHLILYTEDRVWVYADTLTPTKDDRDRICGHCKLPNRPDGHDPCLGTLPGVRNACCGHGRRDKSYIQFEGGKTVRGWVMDAEE